MPRLFVAIDLPQTCIATLQSLEDESLDARWTPAEQYHVTLRFLGNVNEETTASLSQALASIEVRSFMLEVSGLGVFPSLHRPRVLVASILPAPELIALHGEVDRIAGAHGIEEDPRQFNPHITLARLRDGNHRATVRDYLEKQGDFTLPPIHATAFHLYQSETLPEGALHTILTTHPLRQPGNRELGTGNP